MGREVESKLAEQELAKLRKLPENKVCANCRTPGTPLLTAIVVPFKIFVCGHCKSAHQAFSHRCKSSQMSLWTMEEVRQLEEANGGGNRVAQARWLCHAKDSDRPREGDRIEAFKEFVDRTYLRQEWASASGAPATAPAPAASAVRRPQNEVPDLFNAITPAPGPKVAQAPSNAPACDLLLDLNEVPSNSHAPPSKAAPVTSQSVPFDLFDPLVSSSSAAVAAPQAPAFGFVGSSTTAATTPSFATVSSAPTAFVGGAAATMFPTIFDATTCSPAPFPSSCGMSAVSTPWPSSHCSSQGFATMGVQGWPGAAGFTAAHVGWQQPLGMCAFEVPQPGLFAPPQVASGREVQEAKAPMRLEDLQQSLRQLYAAA